MVPPLCADHDVITWNAALLTLCGMNHLVVGGFPSQKVNNVQLQSLQWRHNERDGVSNHKPHDYLLNCLFGRRSKKTLKLRLTGHCEGNSPVTGEFPAQRASNAENVSIWYRHHECFLCCLPEKADEQEVQSPVVRDAMTIMWRHYNAKTYYCTKLRSCKTDIFLF